MTILLDVLNKNPILGFAGSLGGAVLPFITQITPFLQFGGLLMGLAIGILTIREKIKKVNKK